MTSLEALRTDALHRLRDAYAAGEVTTGTLELRVGAALAARTPDEVGDATWDLPRRSRRPPPPCSALAFDLADPVTLAFGDEPRTWLVGRSRSCDVTLGDARVSRRHALVSHRGGRCVVRDLGATNGVFVNGVRIRVAQLIPGDELVLGTAVRATVR